MDVLLTATRISCIALMVCPATLFAQTGPAGVGNSTTNKVWLDAGYLTPVTDGTKVTTFLDKSGNNWNAIQNTSSRRPAYYSNQLNGKPVLRFDRSTAVQYMELTSAGIGQVFSNSNSVFIVGKANSGAVNASPNHIQTLLVWSSGHNSVVAFSGYPNATGVYMNNYLGSASNFVSTSALISQGTWQLLSRTLNENANGTTLTGAVNGTATSTSSGTLQMTGQSDMIRIGAAASSGSLTYALNGDIAEVVVYNAPLNDAQRIIVENYLSAKYNLNISTDKYTWNDPGYTLDVQGIGTTDGSLLNKHSVAANLKGLKLEERNASLDGSGEFLFAGHAASTNEIVTSDLPASVDSRWQRIWYVEKTGTIDATVSFDLSDAGIPAPAGLGNDFRYYKLLYRSSATGAFTALPISPVLENDDQLSFALNDALILNGYYTLGYSESLIWTGAQDEQWNEAANWNLNRVPASSDRVIINSCSTCPALSGTVSVAELTLKDGGKINLNNSTLSADRSMFLSDGKVVSISGRLLTADFTEIKNSTFEGSITLEKNGGSANTCFGGNKFSTEMRIINSSSYPWEMASQSNNVIKIF